MRIRLKVGLLAAVIACGAFVAAKAQEEKSYLPPGWFQQKGETTVPKTQVRAPRTVYAPKTYAHRKVYAKPVRHARVHTRRKHVAAYHRHRRTRVAYYRVYYPQRYAYYRPAFPGFLFGLFNW